VGEREVLERPGQAQVQHGVTLAAGILGQRTGDPGLTHASGGAIADQLAALAQPTAAAQLGHRGRVEAARGAVVEVLVAGVVFELGLAQSAAQQVPWPCR